MRQICAIIVVFFFATVLSGCLETLRHPMAPKQSSDTDEDVRQLEQEFGKAGAISAYYKGPKDKASRDRFITGRLVLINIHYIQFIRRFAADKAQLNTAMDMMQLGVDLATTVAGGASVKAALGAASAGITGTRTSIDKNFFFEQTVPALITAMNAQRKVALVAIVDGIGKSVAEYPLAQAVTDLEAYYFAGTFVGALQAIQKDSGTKEKEADAKIALLKDSIFAEDKTSKRIIAFVWKDGKRLTDQGTVAIPIAKNHKKVRDWMVKNGLGTLATQKFFDNPMLRKAREKAIKEIPIPKAN